MSKSVLSAPHFHDEQAAYEFVEAHVWPTGRVCPHCGVVDRSGKLEGKSTRIGVYKCYECRKPFTVKVGTIFESSHVKLHVWLQAIFLISSSKKGISANQLHRTLGVTLKTAWFMGHRIREAMREGRDFTPMGGEGKFVEADETYVGGKERNRHRSKRTGEVGAQGKEAVFSLVERGGRVRSMHVTSVTTKNLREILVTQLQPGTKVMTDGAGQYRHVNRDFPHQSVNHEAGEYVRGEAHTNTIEGYFSIMKRGINGVYHHVSGQHLKRYLAEFDFRYNNRTALEIDDSARASEALKGIVGKCLTYRTTH